MFFLGFIILLIGFTSRRNQLRQAQQKRNGAELLCTVGAFIGSFWFGALWFTDSLGLFVEISYCLLMAVFAAELIFGRAKTPTRSRDAESFRRNRPKPTVLHRGALPPVEKKRMNPKGDAFDMYEPAD